MFRVLINQAHSLKMRGTLIYIEISRVLSKTVTIMPEVANAQTVDTVNIENLKNIAGASSVAMAGVYQTVGQAIGMAAQNAVSNQQSMNMINQAATTAAVDRMLHMDPIEAISLVKANSGNDVASQMQSLLAALNSGTQGVKAAVNTPPTTPTK